MVAFRAPRRLRRVPFQAVARPPSSLAWRLGGAAALALVLAGALMVLDEHSGNGAPASADVSVPPRVSAAAETLTAAAGKRFTSSAADDTSAVPATSPAPPVAFVPLAVSPSGVVERPPDVASTPAEAAPAPLGAAGVPRPHPASGALAALAEPVVTGSFWAATEAPAKATREAPVAVLAPHPVAKPQAVASVELNSGVSLGCLPEGLKTVLADLGRRFEGVTIVSTNVLHTHNHARGSARERFHLTCNAVDFTVDGRPSEVTAFLRRRPEVGGVQSYRDGVIHADGKLVSGRATR